MDAVDFVFGVYDLKHSDDRQPIECSVTAIVENSSGVQLTWKRRLLNDDDLDTSISEYEYNGLVGISNDQPYTMLQKAYANIVISVNLSSPSTGPRTMANCSCCTSIPRLCQSSWTQTH